jgi:TnpA family transposase
MPLLKVLSAVQKDAFEKPPIVSESFEQHFFTLPRRVEDYLHAIPSANNRIHFYLMFSYYRIARRFYHPKKYHQKDISNVTSILATEEPFNEYIAGGTSLNYKKYIRKFFSVAVIDSNFYDFLKQEANVASLKLLKPADIFGLLVDLCMKQKKEVPSYTELATIITDAFKFHSNQKYDRIKAFSKNSALQNLDLFLESDSDMTHRYELAQYKRISHGVTAGKIKLSVQEFSFLKNHLVSLRPVVEVLELDTHTIKHYAKWVEKSDMHQLMRKAKHKQQFDLICFVAHQVQTRADYLIDILIQSVQTAKQSSLREHQKLYYEQKYSRSKLITNLSGFLNDEIVPGLKNMDTILMSDISSEEKLQLLQERVHQLNNSEHLQQLSILNENSVDDHSSYYDLLESKSRQLQNKVSEIIKVLEFDKDNSSKILLNAIDHYRSVGGNITKKAPQDFLNEEQQELLYSSDNLGNPRFRVSLYKTLLFIEIAEAIKSGMLNLSYSYRYRAFDTYLLDKHHFHNEKQKLLAYHDMHLLNDLQSIIASLKDEVSSTFKSVNKKILNDLNFYFHIRKDFTYNVNTPKVDKDESIDPLTMWLPKDKFIPLISVLHQINEYVNFERFFKHHSQIRLKSRPKTEALLAAIVGYGCNINISKMAKISKGISEHEIDHIRTWFLSNENLMEANDKIIAFTEQLDTVNLFKKDKNLNHTASDGQKFNISVDSLNAGYSFKYFGLGRGVSRYMFVDESHRLFYSTVINANEREAAYVIDGLMHNDVIKSDIHSTDTFGYSEVVFALTHLLGFSFAPRIKNFKDQQLYAFEAKKEYAKLGYKLLPVKQINTALIEEQWDNILRFVLTIKERHSTASQLLKRLTSYSRQHKLYQALREFGRIIKTKFLLNYIDDVELRQQIEKQLNKIESANRFSKAIFFGNNGEYLYANKEEQDIASNSLRLIQNSIICWNYLYFSNKLSREKDDVTKEKIMNSIKNGSIVHWQHINFYGEYDFTNLRVERQFKFNKEAIKRFSIEDE